MIHSLIPKQINMQQSIVQLNMHKFGDIEEIIDNVENRFRRFKKFDILSHVPRDHRFHRNMLSPNRGNSIFASFEKSFQFKQNIRKEWTLLQQSLPDYILVRAYEDMDFMRAVIINPTNSPFYSNGLFFFDIFIPANYPSCAPKIQYRDDNSRNMIPNLDVLGKWKESTILDVLLAIKVRIYNATPYVNDGLKSYIFPGPGSVKQFKKALFLNHIGMTNMLARPPSDFEVFVEGYFRTRAHVILLNYRRCLDDVGADDELTWLFEGLIRTFESNGTYCKHHHVHVDKLVRELQQGQQSKAKEGGVARNLGGWFGRLPISDS